MDIVKFAIILIVIVAVVAVVGWFIRSSGVAVPQPVWVVIYAVCAIVAILFLVGLAGMGPVAVRW